MAISVALRDEISEYMMDDYDDPTLRRSISMFISDVTWNFGGTVRQPERPQTLIWSEM